MYPVGREILVVISDAERRDRVARILADEGFTVTVATEGLAALRAIGTQRYALVVAAIQLPGSLDGVTTVRQARARQPWLKALYVDDCSTRHERGNSDSDEFIVAPFERHELIGCTFELLQRSAAEANDLSRRVRTELRAF